MHLIQILKLLDDKKLNVISTLYSGLFPTGLRPTVGNPQSDCNGIVMHFMRPHQTVDLSNIR